MIKCPRCGGTMLPKRIRYTTSSVEVIYVCKDCGYILTVEKPYITPPWKKKHFYTTTTVGIRRW